MPGTPRLTSKIIPESVGNGRFVLETFLGSGGFGMVYTALDRYRGDRVAIKLEAMDRLSSLQIEAKRLEQLGGSIAPSCRKLGTDKDFRYIALELLGPTLNTMRRLSPNRCLNTETLLRLTSKLLRALEQLHACGIVHQDLKPDNIVIDAANPDVVKFIDFGVSTTYITPQGQHVQPGTVRCVAGTPFYSSLKSQGGSIPTRRDDLESLVYTLVHLGCGSLPWFDSNLTAQQITTLKVQHSDAICRYLPPEFGQLLGYARGLRFDQKPDYKHWAAVFDQRYAVLQRSHDGLMQWAAQPQHYLPEGLPRTPLNMLIAMVTMPPQDTLGPSFSRRATSRAPAGPSHAHRTHALEGNERPSNYHDSVVVIPPPIRRSHRATDEHAHSSYSHQRAKTPAPEPLRERYVEQPVRRAKTPAPEKRRRHKERVPPVPPGRQGVLIPPGQFQLPCEGVVYPPHEPMYGVLYPDGTFYQYV